MEKKTFDFKQEEFKNFCFSFSISKDEEFGFASLTIRFFEKKKREKFHKFLKVIGLKEDFLHNFHTSMDTIPLEDVTFEKIEKKSSDFLEHYFENEEFHIMIKKISGF